ncbi:MAG: histidine phosphatase family protein [Aminivibrio sp.]|jgi:broad specificity phosphatase PhoE|nr:histidine phosphatase family protein [Aminivibrio sp.]
MKRIFLVRHGETDWNREGRFQGQMDISLNGTGLGQARSVAEALKDVPPDRIVASPLSRARETARPLEELTGLRAELCGGLIEIAHGLWEGRAAPEVEAEWPGMLETWHSRPERVVMPGGESLADVQNRACPALLRIAEGTGENIAVFTHDAVLKVLLMNVLDCSLSSFWRFQLANGSITLLELSAMGWRIPLMGEAGHLGSVFGIRAEQKGL